MSMIDWEYYSSHFPNIIPETKFAAVEVQAESEYNRVVKPYMDISLERAQDTIFKLSNFIWSNQSEISGKAVTSVNNNGYSESYAISSPEQMQEAIEQIIYQGVGTRLASAF